LFNVLEHKWSKFDKAFENSRIDATAAGDAAFVVFLRDLDCAVPQNALSRNRRLLQTVQVGLQRGDLLECE
jgi:hypothetical protein